MVGFATPAVAEDLRVDLRARGNERGDSSSITRNAAPSPRTNPSRDLSNGRIASRGWSFPRAHHTRQAKRSIERRKQRSFRSAGYDYVHFHPSG